MEVKNTSCHGIGNLMGKWGNLGRHSQGFEGSMFPTLGGSMLSTLSCHKANTCLFQKSATNVPYLFSLTQFFVFVA